LVLPGAERKLLARIAATTSDAVTLREARRMGSIHTRMEKSRPPRISAEPTPSRVAKRGCTTRVRNSETCSGLISELPKVRYMSAKVWPVPFMITGSSASPGSCARTCWTFEVTSVRAASGLVLRRMRTETVLTPSRLWVLT
jgi:hypothetical protein